MARVLVTRPLEDAAPLAAWLEAAGHEAVLAPLLEIRPLADATIDLAGVQAVLVTSANGIRALAALTDRRDLPVLAVGAGSAAEATGLGFGAVESAGGDVSALAALVQQRLDPTAGALFHPAASVRAGDLAALLEPRGFQMRRQVLYEAVQATRFPEVVLEDLRTKRLDAATFFSPRTAQSFVRLTELYRIEDCCRALTAYCLSPAVAAALRGLGWAGVVTAAQPDLPALQQVLAAGLA
ncbi:uroporphyrinogen-III synthase [Radicibacter daui]|uniref:uroporphyrinogen-III synthase n=1 Tax=Radicibacter daui TaxID=3064829 RepID=UPI004046D2E0